MSIFETLDPSIEDMQDEKS